LKLKGAVGSSFDSWLDEELTDSEFRKLCEARLVEQSLGECLKQRAKKRGFSVRSLASKLKTSPLQNSKYDILEHESA
jgi:hypothetical protein